jgi:phage shock protein PspC (stress-responsive transcriptional regulator)
VVANALNPLLIIFVGTGFGAVMYIILIRLLPPLFEEMLDIAQVMVSKSSPNVD